MYIADGKTNGPAFSWPDGKRIAVMVTFDYDAEFLRISRAKSKGTSIGFTDFSRGQYGPHEGLARCLDMLDTMNIKSTFFVPGAVIETYRDTVEEIHRHGHELACHGYRHESDPELSWIDLKDTATFEYIFGPPNTVLGRVGRQALRDAGIEPIGQGTDLSASFAAAMAREGAGLAFTYRSCRVPGDHFRYLRVGKEGIFLDLALAWPAGKYRSRAASALAELFQEMAPELLER